ncbi:MAG: PhzF family phenazine biosynthesis protein [Immundisolibacter sp.]
MTTPLYIVDAFTDRPFAGNPAAVCLPDTPRDAAWMQALAGEMNLSETAFLHPRADGDWDLRWFTPAVEVDLCGHATLASAHVLWHERRHAGPSLRFHTRSGWLTATRHGRDLTLDLPADPPQPEAAPTGLATALGVWPQWTGRWSEGHVAVLEHAAQVRQLTPDIGALTAAGIQRLIVTAPGDRPGQDFVSRFFAPGVGVPEDPVTGSAHCVLAPYWCARFGRTRLTGFQASRRGGVVGVELAGDRVRLTGQAVTVHSGTLHV